MLLWNGYCHVHQQFSMDKILELKKRYPEALLLAHPECPNYLLQIADHIGSTSSLLKFATRSDRKQFIVATEAGILHQMQKDTSRQTVYSCTSRRFNMRLQRMFLYENEYIGKTVCLFEK
jgi:quinolinate synthase